MARKKIEDKELIQLRKQQLEYSVKIIEAEILDYAK
jgi:hypothetical protein